MKKVKFSKRIIAIRALNAVDSFNTDVEIMLENKEKIVLSEEDLGHERYSLLSSSLHRVEVIKMYFTQYEDGSFEFTHEEVKNAEKVTPEHVESIIVKEEYLTPTDTLTICVLTLKNGASVTGESACADPKLFDKALGEKYARENAFDKAWAFEGYLLKERLFNGS